jgi:hypothetical protein
MSTERAAMTLLPVRLATYMAPAFPPLECTRPLGVVDEQSL